MNRRYYEFDIGVLCVCEIDGFVVEVSLLKDGEKPLKLGVESKVLKDTALQLEEYFALKRESFEVPVRLNGTEFQRRVWQALREIPFGQTRSYKDIAKAISSEKACRAVGGANNKNPVLIIIPCHRVVGFKGDLVGFAAGLDAKKYLLDLEKNKR